MSETPFEEVDHTADWALRVRGRSLAELLRNAATGMYTLAGIRPAEAAAQEEDLQLEAADREGLLVAWLEEVLFLVESRRLAVRDVRFHEDSPTTWRAHVALVPVGGMERSIKAVTYHNLELQECGDGWEATIVFDV